MYEWQNRHRQARTSCWRSRWLRGGSRRRARKPGWRSSWGSSWSNPAGETSWRRSAWVSVATQSISLTNTQAGTGRHSFWLVEATRRWPAWAELFEWIGWVWETRPTQGPSVCTTLEAQSSDMPLERQLICWCWAGSWSTGRRQLDQLSWPKQQIPFVSLAKG